MHDYQIFRKVVKLARKQHRRSQCNKAGRCLYRGPNGLRCFAGFLIEDRYYDPTLEGAAIFASESTSLSSRVQEMLLQSGITNKNIGTEDEPGIVPKLQRIHDGYEVHEWDEQFAKLAAKRGWKYDRQPIVELTD